MVDIPCDNVELDSGEEGEVNNRGRDDRTPIEHAAVGGLTRGKTLQRRDFRMIILQIIGEMFGGMENSLYLYDNIYI